MVVEKDLGLPCVEDARVLVASMIRVLNRVRGPEWFRREGVGWDSRMVGWLVGWLVSSLCDVSDGTDSIVGS